MAERKPADDVESLYSGRLEGISLPDLIWMLRDGRNTGVLTVERYGIERSVYFDEGAIVFAASTDPDDRLGELLLRQGTITLDQLEQALTNLHLGKRLGTLLVEAGAMGADKLVQAVLTQVQMIVLDLFTWESGDYRFEQGTLPTDEVITLNMKTNEILRSGVRRIRSFGRIRRSVGPPRTVYGLADNWRGEVDALNLSEPEQLVVSGLERGDRSIDQLCRGVMLSNFEIHETLWVLKVQGIVVERVGRFAGDDDASHHGNLEAGGFIKALIGLSREKVTGVLYLRRRGDERSFHFRQGRCEFATSSNPDHGLVAFLLMRGVISLRDRQETEKRLLSNKRVGTILHELGVIDDKDLRVMVRQQLSEIVFDTFGFEDGDLSFVPGDLPTNEEITLDASAEALVLEGLRRVTSWSRIMTGCGGMDTPLELTPEYMSVLDAMGAGAAEWQVVTSLKSAKTAREVCRETKLDDFRTCQILWALIELGAAQAATRAEAGESVEKLGSAEQGELDEAGGSVPGVAIEVASSDDVASAERETEIEVAKPAATQAVLVEPSSATEDESAYPEPPSAQQTQMISREIVEAALGGGASSHPPVATEGVADDAPGGAPEAHDPAPSVDPTIEATQAIPRDVVEAAQAAADRSAEPAPPEPAEPTPNAPASASGEAIREPDGRDLEISSRTMQLPRDEVDAALQRMRPERSDASTDAEPEIESAPVPASGGWKLPGDLEAIIERFNAMQRVIYRAIRAEVGAGAANFIRSCCDTTSEASDPLKGAELQSDGSWDTDGLRRAVAENRIREPRLVYQALIEREIELLRAHIGDSRVLELERQIEKVEQATAGKS